MYQTTKRFSPELHEIQPHKDIKATLSNTTSSPLLFARQKDDRRPLDHDRLVVLTLVQLTLHPLSKLLHEPPSQVFLFRPVLRVGLVEGVKGRRRAKVGFQLVPRQCLSERDVAFGRGVEERGGRREVFDPEERGWVPFVRLGVGQRGGRFGGESGRVGRETVPAFQRLNGGGGGSGERDGVQEVLDDASAGLLPMGTEELWGLVVLVDQRGLGRVGWEVEFFTWEKESGSDDWSHGLGR